MSVSFPTLPASWRLPLFWAEVDPSQAGLSAPPHPSLLTGQLFQGAASAAIKGGNTGNGSIAMDPTTPVLPGGVQGAYRAVFTAPTAFSVTDPMGKTVGTGATGVAFANQVKFTITAGGTPYAVGDEIDVTVLQPAGSAVPNVPIAIGSLEQAQGAFGIGSMLERMVYRFFKINPEATLFCLPLADPTGVAQTGTITIGAVSPGAGVLTTYIAGIKVQVATSTTDTATTIAANKAAAINAIPWIPVTATSSGAIVTWTCKWKGATGADINVSFNYRGTLGGEAFPQGVTAVAAAGTTGSGVPSFSAAIAALGDDQYYYACIPYTDTASLIAWDTEYGFTASGRWGWLRQLYGAVFSARRDTYSNLIAYGPTGNSGVESIMAFEPSSPSPVWEWAAAYCAAASQALEADPARPLQTLELNGILPALKNVDRWTKTEANSLAQFGLAVQLVAPSGNPMIMVEQTRWQVNSYGVADGAFGLVTTLYTLSALLQRMKAAITSKYPRHKLANDGTNFAAGQAILTPKIAKGELIVEYASAEFDGLVDDDTDFAANLIVERNATNPNRLDVLWPPELIGQLRIFAVLAQFRLLYPSSVNASPA